MKHRLMNIRNFRLSSVQLRSMSKRIATLWMLALLLAVGFVLPTTTIEAQSNIPLAEPRGLQQPLESYDNLVPNPEPPTRYSRRGVRPLDGVQRIHEPSSPEAIRVLFDQAHSNFYSINPDDDYTYLSFANLLGNAGYGVYASDSSPMTYDGLMDYAVLVMGLPGFSPSATEIVEIQKFVVEGGGLLLIADYDETYSGPSQDLSRIFTVILNEDIVTDSENNLSGIAHWVTYGTSNFSDHPIMQGLQTLQSYSSSSILPYSTQPLIETNSNADPPNQAVAIATEYGLGRVVIVGDSNYFDDIYGLSGAGGDDNAQFALNIINWLKDSPHNEAGQQQSISTVVSQPTTSAYTPTPLPTATTPQDTPPPTFTPTPTFTPSPTYTPSPTFTPTNTPTATPFTQPSDLDADGLLNETEILGWSNSAGFFTTDPSDPDSDNDGLLDGAEKLYNTNPEDEFSPGLHIVYTDELLTKQYAGWERFGNQYLARTSAVVRRGAEFFVGGPEGASIEVTPSIAGLSDISYQNLGDGLRRFSTDLNGTVGTYNITMRQDSWSESMTLHVIFELPIDMAGQDQLEAYLYDDKPDTYKDETSVWFTTMEENYVTNENVPRHRAIGYGLSFQNDQFEPYVIDLTMQTINGSRLRSEATERLAEQLDKQTRFDPTKYYYSMYEVLYAEDQRNQCSNIAAALTGLLRSAGIASRPVVVDWNGIFVGSGYFDTATEVWIDGRWQVTRAYNVIQGGEDPPSPIAGGIVPLTSQPIWGIYHYPIEFSDVIVTAGPGWDYAELNSIASKAYVWDDNSPYTIQKKEWLWTKHEAYWGWASEPANLGDPVMLARRSLNERHSLQAPYMVRQRTDAALTGNYSDYQSAVEGDAQLAEELIIDAGVTVTRTGTYTYLLEANLYDSQGHQIKAASRKALEGGSSYTMSVKFDGREIYRNRVDGPYNVEFRLLELSNNTIQDGGSHTTQEYAYTDFQTPGIYFTDEYTDMLLDEDGDGSYDYLILEAELQVSVPNSYTVMSTLASNRVEQSDDLEDLEDLTAKNGAIANSSVYTYLSEGLQTVKLRFDGTEIFANGNNGPFQIRDIMVLDVQNPSPIDIRQRLIDGRSDVYSTTVYNYEEFEQPAAFFTKEYSDDGFDANDNGLYEKLVIDVGLGIDNSNVYTVVADLFDSAGQFIATATWSNAEKVDGTADDASTMETAKLHFDGEKIARLAADGAFSLNSLRILNADGEVVEWIPIAHTTDEYERTQFAGPAAILTGNNEITGEDSDEDGLFDYLVAKVQVNVMQTGEYRVESWLADENNELVTWSASEMTQLEEGLRTIEIRFDGKAIHANRVGGNFTLSGLNIVGLAPAGLAVIDDEAVVPLTESYELTSFERTPLDLSIADSGIDTTEDGLYEYLRFEVAMALDSSRAYTITADLVDVQGDLVETVTWSNTPEAENSAVVTAQLQFGGGKIIEHGVAGEFTLANLQIADRAGEVEAVESAFTTSAYTVDQFAEATELNEPQDVNEPGDDGSDSESDKYRLYLPLITQRQ